MPCAGSAMTSDTPAIFGDGSVAHKRRQNEYDGVCEQNRMKCAESLLLLCDDGDSFFDFRIYYS